MERKGATRYWSKQAGFSMVEMLMTAFVLAVGILGLTMLQTMSLRASRGSRSLSTAVLVAERVMDQVELEGRLSWSNLTDSENQTPSTAADLPNLKYVSIPVGGNLVETYNSKGGVTNPASPDPIEKTTFFTVRTSRTLISALAVGQISDVGVTVTFTDSVDSNKAPIVRTVSISRRILHG